MATKSWRDKIDLAFREEMGKHGFVPLPNSFTFMMSLSDEVDTAVNIEQGKRYSSVLVSELFVSFGVMHKDLAELEAVLPLPIPSTVPPPHWWHSVRHRWLIDQNLNLLVSARGWCFAEYDKPKKTAATVKSVVDGVVQVGIPFARRFDNLKAIIQEMENPSNVRMKCQDLCFKLPIAYMLDNRFDDAAKELVKFEEQLGERPNVREEAFLKNFAQELRLRSGT